LALDQLRIDVAPLVIAHDAGSEMRQTLGSAVFSGMLGVTFFGVFLTPVLSYAIEWLNERREAGKVPVAELVPEASGEKPNY
jgi:Cu/Ag efflux pump CusA